MGTVRRSGCLTYTVPSRDMPRTGRSAWHTSCATASSPSRRATASSRRQYRQRMERELDAVMAQAPTNRDGRRLRKRYGKVRAHLFTFLDHPEVGADNNSSERELRPTATYRKVTGGFRSDWGADLFAAIRSVVGTAARRGIDAYQAIRMTLQVESVRAPG